MWRLEGQLKTSSAHSPGEKILRHQPHLLWQGKRLLPACLFAVCRSYLPPCSTTPVPSAYWLWCSVLPLAIPIQTPAPSDFPRFFAPGPLCGNSSVNALRGPPYHDHIPSFCAARSWNHLRAEITRRERDVPVHSGRLKGASLGWPRHSATSHPPWHQWTEMGKIFTTKTDPCLEKSSSLSCDCSKLQMEK